MEQRCDNCKFKDKGSLYCRRHPPNIDQRQPIVQPFGWCGEWKEDAPAKEENIFMDNFLKKVRETQNEPPVLTSKVEGWRFDYTSKPWWWDKVKEA